LDKKDRYNATIREIEIRMQRGGDLIGDFGNVAAVLKKRLGFFWTGFYFVRENYLVLGPFQGNPACVYLSLAEGVCSACVRENRTIIVPDVHDFEGHIACDPQSRSEIVIPVYDSENRLRAVLDVDSDKPDHFDETDQENLEKIRDMLRSCWEEEDQNKD
jgi:GAF domain-containing protein